jgi:hypothetical protein
MIYVKGPASLSGESFNPVTICPEKTDDYVKKSTIFHKLLVAYR